MVERMNRQHVQTDGRICGKTCLFCQLEFAASFSAISGSFNDGQNLLSGFIPDVVPAPPAQARLSASCPTSCQPDLLSRISARCCGCQGDHGTNGYQERPKDKWLLRRGRENMCAHFLQISSKKGAKYLVLSVSPLDQVQ